MKARIESTLTLEEVAEHFKQWRSVKKRGERIPQQLWNEALGLVSAYGVSQITRTLRLSGTDFNKRRGIIGVGRDREAAGGKRPFVEIDPVVMDQALGAEASALWMELERPDGLRLRIRAGDGVEVMGVVERFLGT